MKPQRLLYLSAHQMTAYHWQAGVLTCEEVFSASESGVQQFAHYLARNMQSIFSLLANVSEEGFHIETIPFLRGNDRKAVIQRKLSQVFFNAPLSAALSLGHEKSRRKDERILLTALSNTAFFQPWLDIIRASEVALSGIFSLPLLASALLRKLRLPQEPCLLLTVQDQSIRQNYFEKGELHFSRLTPLQHSSIGSIAQTFATESLKLQQYLASQRLIGRNQSITAHILAHQGALKTIQNSCIDTPTVHYNVIDITECASRIGLKTPPVDTHCEALFLHLLVTDPPAFQFASDELRHSFHLARIRSLLHGIGAMALIACLLLSGKLLFDAYSVRQGAAALKAEAELSRQRYSAIEKTFPELPLDNETLKRVMDRYTIHEQRSTSPKGLYHTVSLALQAEPTIELDNLDWKTGAADAETAGPGKQTAGARTISDDSEHIIVRGTLKPEGNANTRQLLSTFRRFVERLKTDANLQVEILQQPFDIEPGKSLRSGDTSPEEGKPRAFILQIIRKIGA